MLRTFTTFLLFSISSVVLGQITETRNSLLKQLIDEIKSRNFREVHISGLVPWDTADYVFTIFLSPIDTTDKTNTDIQYRATRRKITAFTKLVTKEDYLVFRRQVKTQSSDSFMTSLIIKGGKKSKEKATIKFSQPLLSKDREVAIIQRTSSYSSGGEDKSTTVYIWKNDKWIEWGYLTAMSTWP